MRRKEKGKDAKKGASSISSTREGNAGSTTGNANVRQQNQNVQPTNEGQSGHDSANAPKGSDPSLLIRDDDDLAPLQRNESMSEDTTSYVDEAVQEEMEKKNELVDFLSSIMATNEEGGGEAGAEAGGEGDLSFGGEAGKNGVAAKARASDSGGIFKYASTFKIILTFSTPALKSAKTPSQ